MRAIVQRVASAMMEVEDRTVSEISPGLLVLVGVHVNDSATARGTRNTSLKYSHLQLQKGVEYEKAGKAWDQSGVVSVLQQLDYMKECLARRENSVGKARADKIMEDSIFTGLYELGARRFAFAGLPPLGCLPLVMTTNVRDAFVRQCIDSLNMAAPSYNSKLQIMLNEVKEKELKDAKIVYSDIYTPTQDIIKHPNKYGFAVTNRGCCGTGLLEMSFFCNHATPFCPEVSSYVFWDS